jgi:hypothetical protein
MMNIKLKKFIINKPNINISTPHFFSVERTIKEKVLTAGIATLHSNASFAIIGNATFSEIGG